jgi:uncharacterized protein with NAD-binding domain and iron-sulfur cluster
VSKEICVRAVIIGGGLAGMTVAKELLQRQMAVVLLDADSRLGGKAGADAVDGGYEEHGFHVFPGWYANTRRLLRELDVARHLIDLDAMHHLKRGRFPDLITYYPVTSLSRLAHNIFRGLLPWDEALTVLYFAVDLASQSFSRRAFLDRISVNGFLRSRYYRTEDIATFEQQTVLQAGAIPSYELSAMTMQNQLRYWITTPSPMFSILNGNLHGRFIGPFEAHLRRLGATIQLNRRVVQLVMSGDHVAGVRFDDGSTLDSTGPADTFVLATPPEVTLRLVDKDVYGAEQRAVGADADAPRLADLVHLRTTPMAALHLYLNRRIPNIPKEHVNLYGSRYKLSFIDVSQHWAGLEHTTLSLIASDFESLRSLPREQMARYLIEELQEYVPAIRSQDVQRAYMQPNIDDPLFLNTVGSWPFRPGTTTRIANLYTAGDYCQSQADITTMESAVMSGLSTATALLARVGLDADVDLIPLRAWPRGLFLLLKCLGLPVVAPLGLCYSIRRHLRTEG